MDTISHALVGYVAGKGLRLDRKLMMICVASCTVLDLDVFAGIAGLENVFGFHRGPVHSFVFASLLSLSMATVYAGYMRMSAKKFASILLLCLGGFYSHLFLDLATPWGTEVLWPFVTKKVTLSFTPFLDPIFFAVLLSASILVYVKTNPKTFRIIAIAALLLLTVNFGFHYYEKVVAARTVRELYTTSPETMSAPTIWPDEWWVAVKVPFEDGYVYELYQVDSFDEKVLTKTRVESPFMNYSGSDEPPIDSPEKAVEYSKRDEKVASFLEKALLPAVDVTYTDGTWHVFWFDVFSQMNEGRVHSGVIAIVGVDGTLTVEFSMRHPFGRDSTF